MAFVSKEDKARLAPGIKTVLKKYNMKASIAVRNNSTIVVNIKSGSIDIIADANKLRKENCERTDYPFYEINGNMEVNAYHIDRNHSGQAASFLNELVDAMKGTEYFCEDDSMTDYFHRSHYTNVNVGSYKAPYQLAA
tara:strand:- start:65 stop:478 length:414 start_codon:yes stop_codon:yes gene_type:complete